LVGGGSVGARRHEGSPSPAPGTGQWGGRSPPDRGCQTIAPTAGAARGEQALNGGRTAVAAQEWCRSEGGAMRNRAFFCGPLLVAALLGAMLEPRPCAAEEVPLRAELRGQSKTVYTVALSPDGRRAA